MAKKKSIAKKVASKKPLKRVAAIKKAVKRAAPRVNQPTAKPAGTAASFKAPAWPREGAKAPDFTAVAHDGTKVRLADFRGRTVVLYFYPKDDTPGCTVEACGFRDAHAAIRRHKAVVLGVSPDSPRSHEKFRFKYGLPFTLIADESHEVAKKYGAWREKSLYGKSYLGIARSTFVIDAAGMIAKAFTAVKPQGHDKDVLEALAALK